MQTIAHGPADLCKSVHAPVVAERFATKKSRSPKAPAVQLVVCPDKIDSCGDGLMWGRAPSPVQAERSSAVACYHRNFGVDGTRLTRSVAAALSSPAPAPECSTSASRSAATDTAKPRPRTDLPSTHALPPAASVLHRRADTAH